MKKIIAGLLAASCLSWGSARAQEAASPAPAPARPKVVLVLSGGGARGSAHIGVLKVLEEYHVPVDMIVGTSMGSIVGGLYAAGYSVDEIESMIKTIDWSSVFIDRLKRRDKTFRRKQDDERFLVPIKMRFKHWKPYLPPSVIGGQNLELLFQSLEIDATGERDFDKLPIPYRAVAADLSNGRAVVLNKGSLATAMRASMALPGVFPPVELDGKPLTDGGVAANFPIRIARRLGADVIIGVDITSPLRKKEELGSFLTRIDQTSSLLTNGNKEADMTAVQPQDIIVVPDLGDISFSDFAKAEETIDLGEAAARQDEARLRALAVGDEAWAAYTARHHRRPVEELKLDRVVIENTGPLSDAIVAAKLDLPTGGTLDEKEVSRQIQGLYGTDVFGTIKHDFRHEDGEGTLTIQVPKKPYGRNSLQFGFSLVSDFASDIDFNLTVSHLFNPINRRGGEWRNIIQFGDNDVVSTEYYQPLDVKLAWVFETFLTARRDNVRFFTEEGDALASYNFRTGYGRASFGRVLGRWGQLSAGAYRSRSRGALTVGSPAFPSASFDQGGLFASFAVDTRDSVTWPRGGTRAQLVYARDLENFGADAPGSSASLELGQTFTAGKNTILVSAEARDVISGPLSYQNATFLGGFLRLSGLATNQLLGTRGGLARFMYYRELSRFDLGSLTQRMYIGFSLEAGNAYLPGDTVDWASLRRAGSVYVGADTVIGPAYLGYGYCEGGFDSVYLVIGQRF